MNGNVHTYSELAHIKLTDPIEKLTMGTKEYKALKILRINTINDLIKLNARYILGIRGYGHGTYQQVLSLQKQIKNHFCGHREKRIDTEPQQAQVLQKLRIEEEIDKILIGEKDILSNHDSFCEPPPWSLLKQTLPGVLGLSADEEKVLWKVFANQTISALEFPAAEWKELSQHCIYPDDFLDSILAFSLGFILRVWNSDARLSEFIRHFLDIISTILERDLCLPENGLYSKQPIFSGIEWGGSW